MVAKKPRVLILDEPTRGVDVGAKYEIYQTVRQLAANGTAIVFISSELPEVMALSDRLAVMRAKRIVDIYPTANLTPAQVLLFSLLSDSFFTAKNLTNIVLQVSIIAITAYGMAYVLLLGDIDLSVGATIALVGTFAALGLSFGVPLLLVLPMAIIAALLLGLINGALTAVAGIPSFIVTVATMGIFRGVAYIVTDGMPVMISDPGFLELGNGEWLLIPLPIWILALLLLVNHAVLGRTTFGRKIYLTGGNREAALYSGINVTALRIKVFMITALMAGISGLILASRLYSGQPNAALSYELDAIAAAVLGGTSLTGGYGTVVGTMIGALIIGVINNGMNLMNVPYFYQMVVKGLVILVAVYVDVRNKKKRG